MTGITGRVFPFTDFEGSEAEGIRKSYKDWLCLRPFSAIAENYGYRVTTFSALIMSGSHISRLDKTEN